MNKWLILLAMVGTSTGLAAPAWTWVDENGQQHFSDRPVPGAEQVELFEAQSIAPGPTPRTATPPPSSEQASSEQAPFYRVFNVISPSQQETLWNIEGNLNVQLELTPALRAGHHLDVYLNGQLIDLNVFSPRFTVPEVYRGLHSLQAVIVDASGQEVLRSLAVTFMVQQTSLLNPNNPNNSSRPRVP